jgi:hypothetical protein
VINCAEEPTMSQPPTMSPPTVTQVLVGGSPGSKVVDRIAPAFWRALRTLLQGIAGAFPSAGVGTIVLTAGYWQTFWFTCLAALIAALVSFLQNLAAVLPDPGQQLPSNARK